MICFTFIKTSIMEVRFEESWKNILSEEFDKDYFVQLVTFVRKEYSSFKIFPPGKQIFNAFKHCPFHNTKVVIIGQDPYHGMEQAHGLCFSVNDGVAIPPSLINIYKELKSDLGIEPPPSGNLVRWADQGVLLLNATLTVRAKSPGSHQNKGWEKFTDAVILHLNSLERPAVFILWGAYAQQKGSIIDRDKHCIIQSAHPSPFSANRGFFGSRPFSKTNSFLTEHGISPVEW